MTSDPFFFGIDLPYDSLKSCASTSRAILYDALPLVTTLNIEKASQLRIGIVSKQFRDVRSVSIYNLFHISDADNIILDDDIARRSVHFLSRLPHLKRVTFWGKDGNSLCSLKNTEWTFDIEQKRSVYNMIGALLGAFDCGTYHIIYKLLD